MRNALNDVDGDVDFLIAEEVPVTLQAGIYSPRSGVLLLFRCDSTLPSVAWEPFVEVLKVVTESFVGLKQRLQVFECRHGGVEDGISLQFGAHPGQTACGDAVEMRLRVNVAPQGVVPVGPRASPEYQGRFGRLRQLAKPSVAAEGIGHSMCLE
ncbi:MAG: hypothetical protein KIS66_02260 [Fimbriimonadaceae bacterium]|nr:hypothetical protein [Fimbriimonadaceae bacterium]